MEDARRRYWDAVGEEWARSEPQGLWRRHSDAVNARLIARWLPGAASARVLKTDAFDEAVGEGLLPLLASRARSVVEIDVGRSVLHAMRTRYAGSLGVGADVRALPFASGAFGAVVSLSTLDHFGSREEIAAALRELRRVLGAGGRLVLTLDNPWNPFVAIRNALPLDWLRRVGLVPYFVGATLSPRGLEHALCDAGFEVEEASAVLHVPRVAGVALAAVLDRLAVGRARALLLRVLMAWEVFERLPTRRITGHYLAVRARAAGP